MDAASATSQSAQHSPSFNEAVRRARGPWWIVTIVALGIAVRLIGVTQPLVGTFATKHCVYAMIARNWAEGRARFWEPTLDCLAPSGDERAWHPMEWPASAFVAACGKKGFGGDLDLWGRGVSIFCMAAATWLSYLLARRWFGEPAARATSLVVAFAPMGIIYGRGFMLEPSLVALSFLTVYAFDRWCDGGSRWWLLLTTAALSVAMLTKFYLVLLAAGLLVPVLRDGTDRRRKITVAALVTVLALIPLAAWLYWVSTISPTLSRAAEYHPRSRADIHGIPHPLLADPAYYLGVLKNLATVALTPLGLLLLMAALCDRRARSLLPWLGLSALLLAALPLKFHVADYYYLNLLPPAALLIGLGWQVVVERFSPSRAVTAVLVAASLLIAARYTIGPTWKLHDEDRGVVAAAEAIRALAAVDEPVATIHGSTLDLLYYCDRRGWAFNAADPTVEGGLQGTLSVGAKLLVVVHPPGATKNRQLTQLLSQLPLERSGDDWQIYRLEFPPFPSKR